MASKPLSIQQTPSLLITLMTIISPTLAASCYSPAGGPLNSTIAYACPTLNPSSSASMCCLASSTIGATGADICVPAGPTPGDWVCHNTGANTLWRRGCTDQEWKSGGCLRVCADQTKDRNGNAMEDWDEPVTLCSDGSYCCGSPGDGGIWGKACCNKGEGVWVMDGTVSKTKPSGYPGNATASTAASTSASGDGSAATSAAAAASDSSSSSNVGVIAGVVSGSLAALIILGVGQFFLIRRVLEKKMAKKQRATVAFAELMGAEKKVTYEVDGHSQPAVMQLYGSEAAGELSGQGETRSDGNGMVDPAIESVVTPQSGTLGVYGWAGPAVSPMDAAVQGGTWENRSTSSGARTSDAYYGGTRYVGQYGGSN